MTAVSLRAHAEERLEEGRAAIQAPEHPIRVERLYRPLDWRDLYRWCERPRLSYAQRLRIEQHEKKQERLSKLVERLELVGEHIRILQDREADLEWQRIERGQRRIERAKTHLGRLAERLEEKGYIPICKRVT
jgi:hypothetical protein